MENINKDVSDFPSIDYSIEKLLEHAKNKNKFVKNPYLVSLGGTDCNDYTNKGIKRSKFSQKSFSGTIFKNSAAAGSNFIHCNFDNCQFINANFQECVFVNSVIQKNSEDNPITHCNFNRSIFSEDFRISDVNFQHSIFRQTAFINGVIQNTSFYSSTLEDTTFTNVLLDAVRFSDLNIDYSVFENVQMNDVILPFSQVCFTFGLLTYLMDTKDNVYITSAKNQQGCMLPKEFLELLPCFITYYQAINDFFPLANIYLSQGNYQKAQNAILNGILRATTDCDFRQIKYLSKLIHKYSMFNFHQRKHILDYINSNISFYDMNPSLLYNYNTYKSEINGFLLSNNQIGIATTEIDILTNIYPIESKKLGILITTIEQVIECGKSDKGEHSILCRHNSAEEVLIMIQDIYQALEIIIPTIYSVLLGVLILDEKWKGHKTNKLNVKHADELKEIELERARIGLAREKLSLEKEKLDFKTLQSKQNIQNESIENLRKELVYHNIDILGINHIAYGDIPTETDKKIFQYSYKKES